MGIFGLGKNNKTTVVDGAVKLIGDVTGMIDDSKFKPEEKARFQIGMADATAEFVKATLSENTERSKARRHIAILSIYFFYFLFAVLVILWRFDSAWFEATKGLALSFKFPTVFIMIMAFFFGGYYLSKLPEITKRREKKN